MIQANELRIGNWVIGNGQHEGKALFVDAITEKRMIRFKGELIGESENDINGVPLTPEILERAGLMGSWPTKEVISPDIQFIGTIEGHGDDSDNSQRVFFYVLNRKIKVKYLHQLQNLYFALTGEELQIEL